MYAGAHVAPDKERPTTRRLYELTVGAATAQKARACVSTPARNWYAMVDKPMPDLSPGSWNAFFCAAEPTDTWKWAPLPVRFENGFGMNVAIMPCLRAISLAAIFTKVKLSADLSASAYVKLISNWPLPSS